MSAGSLDLGSLYARLLIDFGDLERAERASRDFANRTGGHLSKVTDAFKSTGKVLTASVTLPLVGLGIASFEAARKFSVSFADVQKNISDLDDSNIESFKNQILDIGRNSLLGADGVAALASEGGKLGEASKGAIEFAKAAEQMAVAFDFGKTKEAAMEAGDVLGSIRSSFGYTTEQVTSLGDAVNYFADTTAASSKGIIKILQSQGATVKAVTNLTDGQLTALAATFESISPSVEIAATGMKNFSLALSAGTSATDPAQAVFKQLGLDALGMAKFMKKDAAGAILTVLKSLGKLKDYEKSAAISTLFGKESIGAIAPLIENTKLIEENFKKAADSSKFLGSIRKEYDRAMNTDDNKMALALNALNVVMIQIGAVVLPIVAELAVAFSKWLTKIGNLDPGLVKLGIVAGAVAAAVGPLLLAVGSIVGVIAPAIVSAGGLGAALSGLIAVAVPVALAIAAIAAVGYLLYKNWDEVKKYIADFIPFVKSKFNEWLANNQDIVKGISDAWEATKTSWSNLKTALSEFPVKHAEEIEQMKGEWQSLADGLTKNYHDIIEAGGYLREDFQKFADVVPDTDNSRIFANSWKEAFQGILAGWELVRKAFTDGENGSRMFANSWDEALQGIVALLDLTGKAFNALGVIISDAFNGLDDIPEAFNIVFEEVLAYLKNLPARFMEAGGNLMEGLKNGIAAKASGAIEAVKGAAGAVIDKAQNVLGVQSPSVVFAEIGNFLMQGLGVGITQGSNSAISAMILAADQISKTAKDKLTGEQIQANFGKFESSAMLDSDMGVNGKNYELELAKEQAYYKKSQAMLDEAQALKLSSIVGYDKLRETIEIKHTQELASIYLELSKATQDSLNQSLSDLKSFGGEQSSIYKGIFAVSKAFAIADALVKLQQNIAAASIVGFPYNIPLIAGAVAQGTAIVSNVSAISGAFNNGGYIPTGQVGMVGEKGAEFVTGPANVLSTQNTKELMNGRGGKGSTNVSIEVLNYGNSKVEVRESGSDDEKRIQFIIDRTKESIASDAVRGDGKVDKTFSSVFKLSRTG